MNSKDKGLYGHQPQGQMCRTSGDVHCENHGDDYTQNKRKLLLPSKGCFNKRIRVVQCLSKGRDLRLL